MQNIKTMNVLLQDPAASLQYRAVGKLRCNSGSKDGETVWERT
jgi:hypothetical protein